MTFLVELWLPILASAVGVFVVSSIVHMALTHHKKDCTPMPGEETVLAAMRQAGVMRGDYMFPYAGSMKEMATPQMQQKLAQGPVGYLTIIPSGPIQMGKSLMQWFVYSLVISFLSAYVGWHALSAAAPFGAAMRITGSVATAAYAVSYAHGSIWRGMPWGTTWRFAIDGLAYGLTTGAIFGWLWPA
jgi:hypothetical protein